MPHVVRHDRAAAADYEQIAVGPVRHPVAPAFARLDAHVARAHLAHIVAGDRGGADTVGFLRRQLRECHDPAHQSDSLSCAVIATEAKQSRAARTALEALDCFVAALLAMTILIDLQRPRRTAGAAAPIFTSAVDARP